MTTSIRDYANGTELRQILDQMFQANLTYFLAFMLLTFNYCATALAQCASSHRVQSGEE